MGLGYLTIQTNTGDKALPVKNANVVIRDISGNVLFNLITDESGKTQKISLFAPDKFHTLSPDDAGPYFSTFEVEVTHPNFMTEKIRNVQIYDTIESILEVAMKPLPLEPTQTENEVVIPPPAVQMNREMQENIPTSSEVRGGIMPEHIKINLRTDGSEDTQEINLYSSDNGSCFSSYEADVVYPNMCDRCNSSERVNEKYTTCGNDTSAF